MKQFLHNYNLIEITEWPFWMPKSRTNEMQREYFAHTQPLAHMLTFAHIHWHITDTWTQQLSYKVSIGQEEKDKKHIQVHTFAHVWIPVHGYRDA